MSTSRGGGLLTAVSSKYLAEHQVLSFTELVPGKAAALERLADKGGLTLITAHGPQAGCCPWAGQGAFWADMQMYATARSLGGRHFVVIAGHTNIYMDAATNLATEHFRSGGEACGFRRATAGGVVGITPTLHTARHGVDTFLVNEPLLPWSLRESFWGCSMAHPQGVVFDHLPVCLALPGLLDTAGQAAVPTLTPTRRAAFSRRTRKPPPSSAACGRRPPPHKKSLLGPAEQHTYGSVPAAPWTRGSYTTTQRMMPWRAWWGADSVPRAGQTRWDGTPLKVGSSSRQRSSGMTPWQRAHQRRTRRAQPGMASTPKRRSGQTRRCEVRRRGPAPPRRTTYRRSLEGKWPP